MSNFTERLTELMEHDDHGCCSTEFIKKYAPAIRDLVVSVSDEHGGNHHEHECPICIALSKLDEA